MEMEIKIFYQNPIRESEIKGNFNKFVSYE